jgi:hypothetical protein
MKKVWWLKNGMVVSLYKPERYEWASVNECWYCAIRYYSFGIGVVGTYWGYRVLLGRWQICIHTEKAS